MLTGVQSQIAMTVLAIAMQKGGVGKTTTTLALGAELAQLGQRVLVIDMDPQSNLTMALGVDPSTLDRSIYEVLLNPTHGAELAIRSTDYRVDVLPATLMLAGAELMLAGQFGRELRLRTALQETRRTYNYILIDCPPSLGVFTVNALTAADSVVAPLQAHVFALKAMPYLEETIQIVRQLNPALHLSGIVVTMVDRRTTVNAAVEDEIRRRYQRLVFQTVIPFNVKLVESPAAGQPIGVYAADSSGARAYRALAQEVVARYGA